MNVRKLGLLCVVLLVSALLNKAPAAPVLDSALTAQFFYSPGTDTTKKASVTVDIYDSQLNWITSVVTTTDDTGWLSIENVLPNNATGIVRVYATAIYGDFQKYDQLRTWDTTNGDAYLEVYVIKAN